MLVFHFDDSGEKTEPIQTLAGYVSTADSWREFEQEARAYLDHKFVPYLHTKDLYARKRVFEGWNSTQTRIFAEGLFRILGKHCPKGFEFSVRRHVFNQRRKELGMKREGSPFAFCFKGLAARLVQNKDMAEILKTEGVDMSFVIESGHANQENVLADFKFLQRHDPAFRSMIFEDKKKLIALQVADFLAFFCRRIRVAQELGKQFEDDLQLLEEVTAPVGYAPFLAIDFHH